MDAGKVRACVGPATGVAGQGGEWPEELLAGVGEL
jgi:hypothetical protein